MDSGFQAGSVDTHIIKILKFFIFANTTGFFIIKAYLRGTLQNFVKNLFYKHALEFQVEYYFASVKWFKKNFTKFHTLTIISPRYPWVSSKKFSQFGPAVWPTIANIYTNTKEYIYMSDEVYYIEKIYFLWALTGKIIHLIMIESKED